MTNTTASWEFLTRENSVVNGVHAMKLKPAAWAKLDFEHARIDKGRIICSEKEKPQNLHVVCSTLANVAAVRLPIRDVVPGSEWFIWLHQDQPEEIAR
jgi:hypothetical protein